MRMASRRWAGSRQAAKGDPPSPGPLAVPLPSVEARGAGSDVGSGGLSGGGRVTTAPSARPRPCPASSMVPRAGAAADPAFPGDGAGAAPPVSGSGASGSGRLGQPPQLGHGVLDAAGVPEHGRTGDED